MSLPKKIKEDLKKYKSVYDILDKAYKILRDNPIKITPVHFKKES